MPVIYVADSSTKNVEMLNSQNVNEIKYNKANGRFPAFYFGAKDGLEWYQVVDIHRNNTFDWLVDYKDSRTKIEPMEIGEFLAFTTGSG